MNRFPKKNQIKPKNEEHVSKPASGYQESISMCTILLSSCILISNLPAKMTAILIAHQSALFISIGYALFKLITDERSHIRWNAMSMVLFNVLIAQTYIERADLVLEKEAEGKIGNVKARFFRRMADSTIPSQVWIFGAVILMDVCIYYLRKTKTLAKVPSIIKSLFYYSVMISGYCLMFMLMSDYERIIQKNLSIKMEPLLLMIGHGIGVLGLSFGILIRNTGNVSYGGTGFVLLVVIDVVLYFMHR